MSRPEAIEVHPSGTIFKHWTCNTPVVRYVGVVPLSPGLLLRSGDWVLPDGTLHEPGAQLRCPECGAALALNSKCLDATGWRPVTER